MIHSIRKTLTTLLENAGISENLAADIVGHEKPRITYGRYSGGANLDVKRDALEKISYPFEATQQCSRSNQPVPSEDINSNDVSTLPHWVTPGGFLFGTKQ